MLHSDITPDRLFSLGTGYRCAKVLLCAVELDVFTALGGQPRAAADLARMVGVHSRSACDFFDALVALGLLERDADGRYANTMEASLYLDRNKPSYLGGMFDQFNAREYQMWSKLGDALRTGEPQIGSTSAEHFATIYGEPARFRTFVDAMTAGSLTAAKAIAEKFPWSNHRTLMDIGTAQGCLPVQVARMHPHIIGGGFDLPELAKAFADYVSDNELSERLRFYPGSFFRDDLPAADVLVFGRVLHNWDLATKKMLLRKAYQAIPKGGAVVVYDMLIDDERRTAVGGLLSSLNMLLWTNAGFGYGGSECADWMREAGFSETRIEPLVAGQWMVIGQK
ncbi:methyltransferase [Bradyrhizobium sp. 40]|uniref:acetylserotonin O-methyltransferase n=1 Tax=Bradyrhizobium sp. 40 TaxID=2782674 RepID=UPI001FFE4499|nr:acetylserotonin O-methyltransferase [Bradyrhizobium sp. 40]UPJ44165.1 methyltransferase [Bradyrhizobium sp. 40]